VPPHLLLNAYNAATIGTTRATATLAREQSEPNPDHDEEERSTRWRRARSNCTTDRLRTGERA